MAYAKRLEHARRLLEGSMKSVGEITDESGFENITHFSHGFKKIWPVTASVSSAWRHHCSRIAYEKLQKGFAYSGEQKF